MWTRDVVPGSNVVVAVEETRYEGRGTASTRVYSVTGRYLVLAKLNISNAKQHAKYGSMSSSKIRFDTTSCRGFLNEQIK